MKALFHLTFWIWYLLGALAFSCVIVAMAPYISPEQPWPDWAVLIAIVGGLLAFVAWVTRQPPGQKLRRYKGLCERIANQQAMLKRAQDEQWSARAIDRVYDELFELKQQKDALERQH